MSRQGRLHIEMHVNNWLPVLCCPGHHWAWTVIQSFTWVYWHSQPSAATKRNPDQEQCLRRYRLQGTKPGEQRDRFHCFVVVCLFLSILCHTWECWIQRVREVAWNHPWMIPPRTTVESKSHQRAWKRKRMEGLSEGIQYAVLWEVEGRRSLIEAGQPVRGCAGAGSLGCSVTACLWMGGWACQSSQGPPKEDELQLRRYCHEQNKNVIKNRFRNIALVEL